VEWINNEISKTSGTGGYTPKKKPLKSEDPPRGRWVELGRFLAVLSCYDAIVRLLSSPA
jgi:hypothetical protein